MGCILFYYISNGLQLFVDSKAKINSFKEQLKIIRDKLSEIEERKNRRFNNMEDKGIFIILNFNFRVN